MPRRLPDTTVQWKINIPVEVAARVEMILSDPDTGRPQYGLRSKLVENLLRVWLANSPSISDLEDLTNDEPEYTPA